MASAIKLFVFGNRISLLRLNISIRKQKRTIENPDDRGLFSEESIVVLPKFLRQKGSQE